MILVLLALITFGVAVQRGHRWAQQGVTADNALQNHQKQGYYIGSVVLGLGALFLVVLKAGRNSPWVPSFVLLYTGAYFWHGVLLVFALSAGIFLGLEWPGRQDPRRLQQLGLFLGISFSAIAFLFYQNQPITALAGPPQLRDGVVLQTTAYSCAAATIATLHRQVNPHAQTTERDVIQLAGTNRQGTSTLAEIRAMAKLGLKPEYKRNLAIADLIQRNQLAILHVMEPVGGTRIQHAIALLQIDPDAEILIVANPLKGIQIKAFADLEGYWLQEAVFVTL